VNPRQTLSFQQGRAVVPPRALLFSLATLALPVLATWLRPEWMVGEGALVAWVPAILPAFLLAYYRGWHVVVQAESDFRGKRRSETMA